jgi:transposase-like protein
MERTGSSGKEKTILGGTEGGRSPTEVPPKIVAAARTGEATAGQRPDPEVQEKPVRRTFTAEYKRRILEEADRCTRPGELGALLRREGLYSSHLTTWRKHREQGMLNGLAPKKRGRKPKPKDPLLEENERLLRENARLAARLKQAEVITDVQKKLSKILGIPLETSERSESDE